MIRFLHVTKTYPPHTTALHSVSFEVEAGEFVTIVGKSGSGKTTLIRLLFAEERPTSGKIEIGGWDITQIHERDVPLLRRQIGVVFQDFKLLPRKTVRENVAFALQVCGSSRTQIQEVVPHVLTVVGLSDKADRYPHQLSGGEQQRVAMARALTHRPKILLADEPTGNLDNEHAEDIVALLKKINQFGTTVLLVTHDRPMVHGLKKRVITLDEGRILTDISRSHI